MKRGRLATELLIMLIVVAVTSAAILLLVRADVISVKETKGADVLNTEFIPMSREGYLAVRDFQFCVFADENFECQIPRDRFYFESEVHFTFVVESTVYDGEINLVENYRVIDPDGKAILEIDDADNFYFNAESENEIEPITFKDYFTLGRDLEPGDYKLELVIQNPLLNKQTKLTKEFEVIDYPVE